MSLPPTLSVSRVPRVSCPVAVIRYASPRIGPAMRKEASRSHQKPRRRGKVEGGAPTDGRSKCVPMSGGIQIATAKSKGQNGRNRLYFRHFRLLKIIRSDTHKGRTFIVRGVWKSLPPRPISCLYWRSFQRAFSAAIQPSIWLSSTVSGTAPCDSTASWKRRRSNLAPSCCSARARSSRILISPSL